MAFLTEDQYLREKDVILLVQSVALSLRREDLEITVRRIRSSRNLGPNDPLPAVFVVRTHQSLDHHTKRAGYPVRSASYNFQRGAPFICNCTPYVH